MSARGTSGGSRRSATQVAVVAWLLAACASSAAELPPPLERHEWRDGDVLLGEIVVEPTGSGFVYSYFDLRSRRCRIESRDADRELRPGPCTVAFRFDEAGRVIERRYLDRDERAAVGSDGCATMRVSYEVDSDGRAVEDKRYFGADDAPCRTSQGYAETLARFAAGMLVTLEFKDEARRPLGVRIDSLEGVARVEYEYLQGITDVQVASYHGPRNEFRGRKRLSGLVGAMSSWQRSSSSSRSGDTVRVETTTSRSYWSW